jgi:uncharacterized protein
VRVVLDTNTLVSALLFSGIASRTVPLWQSRRLTVLVSKPLLEEYLRVLAYPKFRLTEEEVRGLIEMQLLPFVETVTPRRRLRLVKHDPDDNKFLECAAAGRARYLITGDRDLLELGSYSKVAILSVGAFLKEFGVEDPRDSETPRSRKRPKRD